MSQYCDSTQAEAWQLLPATLEARRQAAHARAVASHASETPLTPSEEACLRTFHERRILRLVTSMRFPDKVAATAISYFKRFYVDVSVMDYNPSVIALAALYAACKVEEVLLAADSVVERADAVLNTDRAETTAERVSVHVLLAIELAFLQQIKFHLICYHPFRSLGILREHLRSLKSLQDVPAAQVETTLGALIGRAEYIVRKRALLSDVPLTHTPAEVAIAAVVVAGAEAGGPAAAEVYAAMREAAGGDEVHETVRERVDDAVRVLQALGDHAAPDEAAQVGVAEARRRALVGADNFVTRALGELEKDRDLEAMDKEEAELSRAARRKREAVLGGDIREGGNGDVSGVAPAKKQRVES